MSKSRTKKASYNIVSSLGLEILTMISGLILPRYILQYFGSSYNGITSSASQFLSIISVLTVGVTASTRVALYKTLAKQDIDGTSAIIRATERYMRKIACLLLGYIILLSIAYPIVINTGFSYFEVASLILIVGMSSFAEYFFGITYYTFLLADQSVYISNIFTSIAIVLNTILSILLIVAGCSIQVVKFGSMLVFTFRPFFQNIYVTRKYRLNKHCEPDMTALNKRGDAMMHALANIVHDNTDIIILTFFTDIKTVSVYTIYNMIMASLKKIQSIFTTGTEPIFGSMWANGEKEKIVNNLSVFEYFVNSFNVVAFGTAMVMVLPFISLYVPRNVTDINYILPTYAFVISLAFATQGMRVPYLALVQGVGHYKQTKKAAVIEAVINLLISVVFVNFIGIVGVAIGTLVANIYRTLHYALYIDKNIVSRGRRVVFLKFIWSMMCLIVIIVPSYWIVQKLSVQNWGMWVAVSCAVGVYAVIIVLLGSIICFRSDMTYAIRVARVMVSRKIKK